HDDRRRYVRFLGQAREPRLGDGRVLHHERLAIVGAQAMHTENALSAAQLQMACFLLAGARWLDLAALDLADDARAARVTQIAEARRALLRRLVDDERPTALPARDQPFAFHLVQ